MIAKRTCKKKHECSSDEWAANLLYHRERRAAIEEEEKARIREYQSRPEVKERRKSYDSQPHRVEARKIAHERAKQSGYYKSRYDKIRNNPEDWTNKLAQLRKHRTGFTRELVDGLLEYQQNKCAICGTELSYKTALADHCHDSNKPRGLLCRSCNTAEGMIRKSGLSPLEFGRKLAEYLEHPPASFVNSD